MEFHTHTCDQTKHKHYPIDNDNNNNDEEHDDDDDDDDQEEERQSSTRAAVRALTSQCPVQRIPSKQHNRFNTPTFVYSLVERERKREAEKNESQAMVANTQK